MKAWRPLAQEIGSLKRISLFAVWINSVAMKTYRPSCRLASGTSLFAMRRTRCPLRILAVTPHRFRTKRQLWTYSGLGLETHDSAQYRFVDGRLSRSKKSVTLRGLNKDHNHDLKDIFKGAATRVSSSSGPLRYFYEALLAKGKKPTMARLTLARKIAAITLIVWKKEVRFDANYLKPQAA